MILHGLFLCITSFVVGVILTWLFFAWKMDREVSSSVKLWKDVALRDADIITHLIMKIHNMQQQEKQQCQE